MGKPLIVPSIRSREVACTKRSGIRHREKTLQTIDFPNGLFSVHPSPIIQHEAEMSQQQLEWALPERFVRCQCSLVVLALTRIEIKSQSFRSEVQSWPTQIRGGASSRMDAPGASPSALPITWRVSSAPPSRPGHLMTEHDITRELEPCSTETPPRKPDDAQYITARIRFSARPLASPESQTTKLPDQDNSMT